MVLNQKDFPSIAEETGASLKTPGGRDWSFGSNP